MTNTPPYQVTDPATGEVAKTFPVATGAEVEQALASASAAFTQWRRVRERLRDPRAGRRHDRRHLGARFQFSAISVARNSVTSG